jgi:hypothetical protein
MRKAYLKKSGDSNRSKRYAITAVLCATALFSSLHIFSREKPTEEDIIRPKKVEISTKADSERQIRNRLRKWILRKNRKDHKETESNFESVEKEITRKYTRESLTCKNIAGSPDFDPFAFSTYFDHRSMALENPARNVPPSYSPPYHLLQRIEEVKDENVLLRILKYLDSVDVMKRNKAGSMGAKVQDYLLNVFLSEKSYNGKCVALTGESYLLVTRVIMKLIDSGVDNHISVEDLINKIPKNFHDVFYDRLSISLFSGRKSFSPAPAAKVLNSISSTCRWEFYDRLFLFFQANSQFRANAKKFIDAYDVDCMVRNELESVLLYAKNVQQ